MSIEYWYIIALILGSIAAVYLAIRDHKKQEARDAVRDAHVRGIVETAQRIEDKTKDT